MLMVGTPNPFGPGLGEVIAMQHCYRLAWQPGGNPTRAREMNRFSRRQVIAGAAAATMLGTPSVRSQTDQQTLRFIAEADLKVLDPIWTTAYITRNHGYLLAPAKKCMKTTGLEMRSGASAFRVG